MGGWLGWAIVALLSSMGNAREEIAVASGQLFYLQTPPQISRVLDLKMHFESQTLSCQTVHHQIMTSVLAQYRLSGYRPFSSEQQQWPHQIVSARKVSTTGTIWILTSVGDIIELGEEWARGSIRWSEIKKYRIEKERDWVDGELVVFEGRMFLWEGRGMTEVVLGTDSWSQKQWAVSGEVIDVKTIDSEFFVLTSDQLYAYNSTFTVRSINTTMSKSFDLTSKYIYILSDTNILTLDRFSLSVRANTTLQQGQWSKRVAASDSYVLVYFQKHKRTVVREFKVSPDGTLSPGIIHRQFQHIKEMLVIDHYALIFQSFELILFQLDLNYPDSLAPSKATLKYQNLLTVHKSTTSLQLLTVGAGSVQQIQLRNVVSSLSLFGSMLMCSNEQVGQTKLTVDFKGLCALNSSELCSQSVDYEILTQVNVDNVWLVSAEVMALIGLGLALMLCLGVLLRQGRKVRRAIVIEKVLLERRRIESKNNFESDQVAELKDESSPQRRGRLELSEGK